MNCKFAKTNRLAAVLRRTVVTGGLALATLLGGLAGAGAQSPIATSPAVPTPYSWPNFHAGGPQLVPGGATAQYALPDAVPFPDPLSWQLNGTPTGIVAGSLTEIPSFLIGNYVPAAGPSGPVGQFFTNHFRDGSFYQIAGPFPFIYPDLNTTPEVVDDMPVPARTAPNNFLTAGAWNSVNNGTDNTNTFGTATNQEYLTAQVTTAATPTATARWFISPGANAPTPLPAGFYSIFLHLPNSPDALTNSGLATPVHFSADAHYIVQLNPSQFGNPNLPGFNKIADVRIQQGINNNQVLAGPFLLAAGDIVTVTLDNSTNVDNPPTNTIVVADSISLQQDTGGDVESAPAAVNAVEYPEIANALYYGLQAGGTGSSTAPPVTTPPAPDRNPATTGPLVPRGNQTVGGAPITADRAIRQLTYFGRLETIIETTTTGGVTTAVRDPKTGEVVTQQVGAIYCMDGFTGGIVWRYQTPGTYDVKGNNTSLPGPVFSSPALARINVINSVAGGTPTYATKLVVIIGDDRGFVYCLDAVGNRNGTSNSNAVYQLATNPDGTVNTLANAANTTTDFDLAGQPILRPTAAYQDAGDTTNPADPPHEGNTNAYWIYRPDPLGPKVISGANKGAVKTVDPASDLPVPGAFGLASPTVYTDGTVATDPTTNVPASAGVAALTSNSIVYIGNSNGVLYAIDGLGYPVNLKTTPGGVKYLDSGAGDPFNTTLDVEDKLATGTATTPFIPTPKPLWWFSIRGAVYDPANTSTATIESAPAVLVDDNTPPTTPAAPRITVYVTSAHESSAVPSSGRLYALDGHLGPSGNGGASVPTALVSVAGTTNYNVSQRPQLGTTDTFHWSFPDAYGIGRSSNQRPRPPLGNITGSPVVFANPNDIDATNHARVRIYIAANSGPEVPFDNTSTTTTATVPDDNTSGRVWSVETDGRFAWSYPAANDPNNAALQNTVEPSPPMGAFLHAAPAMGLVQFPGTIIENDNTTPYTHVDRTADVKGRAVPMLYIATSGYDDALSGSGFYGLDIDTLNGGAYANAAAEDDAREIIAIPSPSGASFVSTPSLVVNASSNAAEPGNGGAVFVVDSSNNLVQFGATPITNNFNNYVAGAGVTPQPYFPIDKLITGLGPISAPSLGAGNVLDLIPVAARPPLPSIYNANNVQDWVYVGSSDGLCFGITPAGSNGGGFDPGTIGPPPGPGTGPQLGSVSNQFILHTHIETDPTNKLFPSATEPPAGGSVPGYEWGQDVYIRITNVVPPMQSGATLAQAYKVYDDQTGDIYVNGRPVTFSITGDSPSGQGAQTTTPRTIPATVLTPLPGTLPGEGFVIGGDTTIPHAGPTDPGANGKLTTDSAGGITASGDSVWVAATTFQVRNEEPGAQHRIISATQVADHYTPDGNGGYTFVGSVTLQATLGQGTQFVRVDPKTNQPVAGATLNTMAGVTQPVFAVLNPLAVRGGGVPLIGPDKVAVPIGGFLNANADQDGVGPFRGLTDRTFANGNTFDLQALTNGNRVYTSKAPPASISSTITASGGQRRRNRLTGFPQRNVRITTSTGMVSPGTAGSNADPNATTVAPLVGTTGNVNNGLAIPANTPIYGQYTLDVADRSDLGLAGLNINNLRMERHTLGWNDNSGISGSATGPINGPGAAINPLPWDDTPVTGSNTSRDYPDISANALAGIVNSTDIASADGSPDVATITSGSNLDARNVFADPIQIQVTVPHYQPANLQFWDQTTTTTPNPITPEQATAADDTFPMGYINTAKVYVDTNNNGRWDAGEAYRNVQVYSGVPVDMTTTIDTSTVDLGRLPQGFGLGTDGFPLLGTFMPYPTAIQLGATAQSIRNPGYVQFFKPLHISNRGNVNLLNVHLDQKVDRNSAGTAPYLSFGGDSLDPTAFIPAADTNGITGPRPTNLPGGTPQLPYLLRSSLDDDLVNAFGRNPAVVAAGAPYNVFGLTFHKARPSDGSPSIMTVPDVPHDNNPGFTGYLPTFTTAPPIATANGLVDPNNNAVAAQPYIALAIPQGTPVGTYSQSVRLFEGMDPGGYRDIGLNGTNYVPILPPQYGHTIINPATGNPAGQTAYTPPAADVYSVNGLLDTWQLTPNSVPMQPASSAAVVKATVTEARITDNMSRGDLPQVDNGPITVNGKAGVADFLPSAFRDPGTGSVSLYWTSSRNATATQPYTLVGANLPFNNTFFQPTSNNNWWKQINLNAALPAGFNTGISVTPPAGGNAYAFVQNVAGAPYGNSLYCTPVAPDTGIPTGANVLVSRNPSQPNNGARGLTFSTGLTVTDPLSGTTITPPNLWAFWYSGARNRSVIYYAGAQSADVDTGTAAAFGVTAALPVPAGIVSVSDPSAVLTTAPNGSGAAIPVIEVTYTGIGPDGNSDIYVSRYQPYRVQDAKKQPITDPNNPNRNVIGLALLPSPPISEQLDATDGNLWWQARDVAWANPTYIPANGGGFTVTNGIDVDVNGTNLNLINIRPTLDRATGTLVYTGTTLPKINVSGVNNNNPVTVNAVYVDLARGRVRFSLSPQVPASTGLAVYASFTSQARRITTDPRADSAPVSFLDETKKQNEANSAGANLGTVDTNRYWFLWRKSGASGTSTTPTLYYKTQRLTVDLQLRDATTGLPIGIKLKNVGTAAAPQYVPDVTVTTGGAITLFNGSGANLADVDWVRGRIYLPLADSAGNALEGASITVTGTDSSGKAINVTDRAHWMDEPRYNDKTSPTTAVNPPAAVGSATTASATGDAAIPIDTIVNESNVTAFLDPSANATTNTHKVWLFWNSTRNGTADIYYETISPRFSASVGQ